MIKKFYITGDTHKDFSRFQNYPAELKEDPESAVIVLGDAALNWTLDENDSHMKNYLSNRYNFRIYLVRGNHEARPQNVEDMTGMFDPDVSGYVYYQKRWPNIRYFADYDIYWLNNHRTLVIGGAYSVDKYYRLDRGLRWFEDEQLTQEEKNACLRTICVPGANKFDLVLTHTCPLEWEPTDLFLSSVDQSKVDKSMEYFLQEVKDRIEFKSWLFGHYHDDRLVRPHVEMLYKDTESLDDIFTRWEEYDRTQSTESFWWIKKDPKFFIK